MRKANNSITKVPFHKIALISLATPQALPVQPTQLGAHASGVADQFEEFRITQMKFRLHPNGTGAVAMGFLPGISDTAPNTVPLIGNALASTIVTDSSTKPSEWVSISKSDLAGASNWYKSVAGVQDAWDEIPGYFYLAAATSTATYYELRGVVEYKGAVDNTNTPQERARIQRERERKKLLDLLRPVLSDEKRSPPLSDTEAAILRRLLSSQLPSPSTSGS